MESGLQELKFSRYNQKVELSGKLFLYNALTGGMLVLMRSIEIILINVILKN